MLHIVFEDEALLIVNKASGVLSQPGRYRDDSVVTQVRHQHADARGPLLVHRLDMDTSGLILIGKTRAAHRHLQQQFEHRQVRKRYTALLPTAPLSAGGLITLPLSKDWESRPAQCVDFVQGKLAVTAWHLAAPSPLLSAESSAVDADREKPFCRVHLYPLTGRTHQLRVHMAAGLGLPIVGDRLYGQKNVRLMLHADQLQFTHPETLELMNVSVAASF